MRLLSNTPSKRRRGLTPNYLFLGEETSSNFFDDTNSRLYVTLVEEKKEESKSPEKMQQPVDKIREALEKEREKADLCWIASSTQHLPNREGGREQDLHSLHSTQLVSVVS